MTNRADLDAAREWLATVYGDTPGLINIVCTGNWAGAFYPTDEAGLSGAVDYIRRLDDAGKAGIYARVTTVKEQPPEGRRGSADLSLSFPGFWADIDIAGPGHKTDKPLPPDTAAAFKIVETSGLPEPTLWVHSGGGVYPWWMLRQPLIIDDTNRDSLAALSARWQKILGAASERLGYHYGTGVGDLTRVLRIPGTVNRKEGLARPCQIHSTSGETYELRTLADLVTGIELPAAPTLPSVAVAPPPRRPIRSGFGSVGPFDALAEAASWRDFFEPLGWAFAGTERDGAELWRRPGGTSAYSVRCGYNGVPVAVVHSEETGLPSGAGHKLTMGRLLAHLHYAGDEHAAAADLRAAAAGSPTAGAARRLRATVLDHVRRRCDIPAWTQARGLPVPDEPLPPPPPGPDGWEPPPVDEPPSFVDEDTPEPGGDDPFAIGEGATGPDVRQLLAGTDEAVLLAGRFPDRETLAGLRWTAPGSEARDRPLPVFPVDALPGRVGEFATAVATYTQVPVDLVAFAILGALALVVGGHATINGQWRENALNLYLVSILDSGEGKSPAFDAVTPPVRDLERRLRAEWKAAYEDKAEAYDIALKTRDQLVTKLSQAADKRKRQDLRADLDALNNEIKELKPPPKPQLFVGDILPEALARLMHRVGGHAGVMSAEGNFLGNISGRYNNGRPNLELVLVSYDTSEPYRVERIGRDPFEIDRPSLSISLAVQPVVIADLTSSPAVTDRGFLNRFLLTQPQSLAGRRDPKPPRIPAELIAEWHRVLTRAYYAVLPGGEKFDPETGEPRPPAAMQVTPTAEDEHLAWRSALEWRLDPDDGDLAPIKGWARKLTGTAYRLSGILHLAAGLPTGQPVDSGTMRDALTIADYCIPHAQVVLTDPAVAGGVQLNEPAQHVLGWIRRKRPETVTVEAVRVGLRGRRWVKELGADGVRATLVYLAKRGWLASVVRSDAAGRRLGDGAFVPHPDLLQGAL